MAYENVTLKVDSGVADILRRAGMSVQEAFDMFCKDVVAKKSGKITRPKALDEMTKEEIRARIRESMEQMERGEGQPAEEAFAEIRRGIGL